MYYLISLAVLFLVCIFVTYTFIVKYIDYITKGVLDMLERILFDPECITYSQMNLIFNIRMYYRRLTSWTWAYIISRYFGVGSPQDVFSLLYLETLDIGDMLRMIFGRVFSESYSRIAGQYPIALRNLIDAQIRGDIDAIDLYIERLYNNVERRASYIESINPYWTAEEYRELFYTYNMYILELINSIILSDYSRLVETFDQLKDHTNRMGDVFAEGVYSFIHSGIPTDYESAEDVQCITYEQMNEVYNIRMLWFELDTWIRNYFLSAFLGIGIEFDILERLRRVMDDFIGAIGKIYGDEYADESREALYEYFELLKAYINAQIRGDVEELNRLVPLLYENAERRAGLIARINTILDESEWRDRFNIEIRYTIEEAVSFISGNYAESVRIYSRLMDLAESLGNFFAVGLFDFLFSQRDR
jgi:hypothetical protein